MASGWFLVRVLAPLGLERAPSRRLRPCRAARRHGDMVTGVANLTQEAKTTAHHPQRLVDRSIGEDARRTSSFGRSVERSPLFVRSRPLADHDPVVLRDLPLNRPGLRRTQVASGSMRESDLMISGNGDKVEVTRTDDGIRTTWSLRARMWQCKAVQELAIVNTSTNGPSRSNPLTVLTLRSEEDRWCPEGGGPSGPIYVRPIDGNPEPPSNPNTSTTCPGGVAQTIHDDFVVCSNGGDYHGISACSFADASEIALPSTSVTNCRVKDIDQRTCEKP